MPLSNLAIKNAPEGVHSDGSGLYLQVTRAGAKSWLFRYQLKGRRREMGLGSFKDLSAAKARARVEELKERTRKGIDPLEEALAAREAEAREEARQEKEAAQRAMTFRVVAEEYIASHRDGWRNAKHAAQWGATLRAYAFPIIGDLPVAEVTTNLVLDVLRPIWTTKPETASRVRSRVELVISYAKARDWFVGQNPAVWRGHLSALLPAPTKVRKVRHFAALAWPEIAEFMKTLADCPGVSAKALEFAILTAARSGEVRGARWSEIDVENGIWTVPAERMKAGREHRSPLSDRALALLRGLPRVKGEELVFPGTRRNSPLSDMSLSAVLKRMGRRDVTVHGFRSTFRDWAAEVSLHHPDIVETALAHVISNKVEAAYRRGDLLEKRRLLMQDWANWCSGRTDADE
jgi:integrase